MKRLPGYVAIVAIICGIALFWNGVIGDPPPPPPMGSRPQSVAVSPDGNTVLATSMGSDYLTQIQNSVRTHIPVGSPSWGVCILSNTLAVVSHPRMGALTVLTRASASEPFTVGVPRPVPLYCTEIIKSPALNKVLVANRGMPPAGAQPWQHSVLEVDLAPVPEPTRVIAVEREPRALAVSSDGARLFVGHVQGALGQVGFGTVRFDKTETPIYDGGSVVMYDFASGNPLNRFPIGSPVRGLAIWPSPAAPIDAQSTTVYRLFVSSVGDGAQSEAPGHGGRAIPNVITSIVIKRQQGPLLHVPQSRTNSIFRHNPDYDPTTVLDSVAAILPAIVHDRMAIRWRKQGQNYFWHLWIANAGSGTVSLVPLSAVDGSIPIDPTPFDITASPLGEGFEIITGKGSDGRIDNSRTAAATSSNATIFFDRIPDASQFHVNVDAPARRTSAALAFAANPTDIEFDPANNRMLVVTHFDHQLVTINVPSNGIPTGRSHTTLLDGPDLVIEEERNFFTFGRGFDFRELTPEDPKVQTQACISCHVDGHIDGKVRHTVVLSNGEHGNNRLGVEIDRPVAVPSVFDVGATEWIFFEGLRTIRDGQLGDPHCNSIYCVDTEIFSDTDLFTNVVQTPPSPIYSGSLTPAQEWGRYYFQEMNCTRCHGGTPPGAFIRTNPTQQSTVQLQSTGPLPLSMLASNNRLLHDPTQSFLSNIEDGPGSPFGGAGPPGDNVSFRNMTDVGTRVGDPDSENIPGVNVPALAGAWDNAPYFHDGRYATLEEVLEHTWLNPVDEYRAAPLFPASGNLVSPADNAFNSININVGPPGALPGTQFYQFNTHAPLVEGRVSVAAWLGSRPPIPTGETATQALLAFLRTVSSQSDLCKEVDVIGFNASMTGDCSQGHLTWSTSSPILCTVKIFRPGNPTPVHTVSELEPESHYHNHYVPLIGGTQYYVTITMDKNSSPRANSPVCAKDTPVTFSSGNFTTASCSPPCHPPNCPELERAELQPITPTALRGASPNPVVSVAEITFSLSDQSPVRVEIFDLQGRKVRTLMDGSMPPGVHRVAWDRVGPNGTRVSAGTYYVRMVAGEFKSQRKLVLLR